ncbi:DUF7115 domain-containing protein [Natronolimnobius baerhuensis]|uniref:DUF7115 domain-containing protein n=1 Tax=Natronolimnobius baerhuensis TaxID=253108 RepID=A0A202E4Q8_9EURY|nr:hypothetical protein [Natronolimnobius baerhuensis]OVE83211.1 hypothetical protein B2G88_17560 [Natronolimnobius baerhuensis]
MSVPGIVHSTLEGEDIAARVSLGGEDELFITASSTFVYRSDGLLRDESVDEYPHNADRLTLSEGRRKTKFSLEYSLEGENEFSVPSSKTDTVLHPVLAGVLNGNGITNPGETVVKTYRFSELTIIITSERLVKHIGSAVWDEDYEEYHYEDVTNLSFEDGSVATQVVLAVDGRPQRIKAPNDEANDLRERLQRALFDYHGVGDLEELNDAIGDDEDDVDEDSSGSTMEFGSGVDPLDANPPELDDHESVGDVDTAPTPEPELEREAPATDERDDASADTAAADSAVPASIDARREDSDDSASAQTSATGDTPETNSQPTAPTTDSADESEPTETGSFFEDSDSTASAWDTDDSSADPDSESSSTTEEPAVVSTETAGESSPTDSTSSTADPAVLERLDALETTVEQQNELLEQQQQTIEQLIEELRHGR